MPRPKGSKNKSNTTKVYEAQTAIKKAKDELDKLQSSADKLTKEIAAKREELASVKKAIHVKEKAIAKQESNLAKLAQAEEMKKRKQEVDAAVTRLMNEGVSASDILLALNISET